MQRNKDRKLDGRMIALFALSLMLVAAAAAIVFADTDANAGNSDDSVNYIPPKPHPSPDDDEEEPTWPLICGDGVKCVYGDFTLTLYKEGNGTGRMFDYDFSLSRGVTEAPWGKIYKHIEKVVVKEGVTYIGEEAFFGCKNIKTVKLTDPVSIGRYAFWGCSSLGSVDLSNVTGVGEHAFSYTNLKHISLPNAKFIGKYAFPESATFVIIGNEAWVGMDSHPFGDLEFYTSDGERIYESNESFRGHMYYRAGDSKMKVLNTCGNGIEFWIDENKHEMKIYERGDSDGEIRFDMDLMGNLAEPIRSVVIEEGIRSIGNNAFKGFASLESISLPSSMRSIGAGAFAECTRLKSIAIPNIATVGSNAFKGCVSLTEVSIMHACVAADAFPDHRFYLKNGDKVDSNEKNFLGHTFKGQSIKKMNECSLRGICGSGVVYEFAHSTSELSVFRFGTGSGHMENFTNVCPWDSVKDLIKSVKICDGVSVSESAFAEYVSIEKVVMEKGVKQIGKYAFSGCSSLTSITLPDGIKIGDFAFLRCSSLPAITIPGTATIDKFAFYSCTGLTVATFVEGTRDIPYGIFIGCYSLKYVDVPSTVKSIESYAFQNCNALSKINIPNGVESIGNDAFSGCESLESIYIPGTVTSLKSNAFKGCTSLCCINVKFGTEGIAADAFPEHKFQMHNGTPVAPDDRNFPWHEYRGETTEKMIAQNESGWCGVRTAFYFSYSTGEMRIDSRGGFREMYDFASGKRPWEPIKDLIKSVKIVDIENIGSYAFADCISLKSVNLPNDLKSIGISAFEGCKSLEAIEIPGTVTSLRSNAFKDCTSLLAVTINNNAKVSSDAFPSHRFSLNGVAITPDNQHFAGHTYRGESIEKMAANDAGNGVANAVSKLQNIRPECMRISI